MKKIYFAATIFVFAFCAAQAEAANYFVRTDGNDACNGAADAGGTSGNCAKRTIQAAVNLAYPGDTVTVHAGDYSAVDPSFTTARAGNSGNVITVQAAPGETVSVSKVRLLHSYTKAHGFRVVRASSFGYPGIAVDADNVIVSGNTVLGRGMGSFGVQNLRHRRNVLVTGNIFEGSNTINTTFNTVMALNGYDNKATYNIVRNLNNNERIWEFYGDGLYVAHNDVSSPVLTDLGPAETSHPDLFQIFSAAISTNVLVENNYFHDYEGQIGNLFYGADPPARNYTNIYTFRNNIFANISNPINMDITTYWYNNIFYHCLYYHQSIFNNYYSTARTYAYNSVFIGNGYGKANGTADAQTAGFHGGTNGASNNFVSTISGGAKSFSETGLVNGGTLGLVAPYTSCLTNTCNFQLGSNSALINKGIKIDDFSTDALGASRPYGPSWDIGPYEYGGTPSAGTVCGQRGCEASETCSSCPADCGQCQTTPACTGCIEAESGTLASPMANVNDANCSGGQHIETNTAESGTAAYLFNIATAGTYKFSARVYAATAGNDSFYFKVDNNDEDVWDLNPSANPDEFNLWYDDDIAKRGIGDAGAPQYDPYSLYLAAGTHTISFRGREASAKMDYLKLVPVQAATKKGDLNNDGKVDVTDLGMLLGNWGVTTRPAADLNQDGKVDVTDLGVLLGNWG